MKKLEEYVRSIPDFPEKGIIFRDVTSVLQDADGLHLAINEMDKCLEGIDYDVVDIILQKPLSSPAFFLLLQKEYNL